MKEDKIQHIIEEYQKKTTAPLGAAFFNLKTGVSCGINLDKEFPTASVFKIFVLAELLRMEECGEVDLLERVVLSPADIADGSGLLMNFKPGCALTIYDYTYLMMAYSDNTATNIVMRYATCEKIRTDILEPFGFKKTKICFNCTDLLKESYSIAAPDDERMPSGKRSFRYAPYFCCETERNDSSTPNELVKIMKLIFDGKLLSAEGTEKLISIMKKCALNQRIPSLLPKKVEVAHKTGSLDRVANDVGVVHTEKGSYILALLYNGNLAEKDEYINNFKHLTGNALLSGLSKEIYNLYIE